MAGILTILGFMGSGKSTIGKMLAKKWGYEFIDLDHYIESQYHLSISQIFDKYQEKGFRKLESKALSQAFEVQSKTIISLGGGTPCFENNIEKIKSSSTSIYLKISPSELVNRLLRSANPRPLVKNKSETELLDFVKTELTKREIFYLQADHIIESDCIQLDDLLTFISRPD